MLAEIIAGKERRKCFGEKQSFPSLSDTLVGSGGQVLFPMAISATCFEEVFGQPWLMVGTRVPGQICQPQHPFLSTRGDLAAGTILLRAHPSARDIYIFFLLFCIIRHGALENISHRDAIIRWKEQLRGQMA